MQGTPRAGSVRIPYPLCIIDQSSNINNIYRTRKERPELSDCADSIYNHLLDRLRQSTEYPSSARGGGIFWVRSSKLSFCYEVIKIELLIGFFLSFITMFNDGT